MSESYYPVTFSPIIVGAMRLGKWGAQMTTDELEVFVKGCIELGVTTFDHADIYGDYTTEADFGKVLAKNPEWRSQMQIITKCGICHVCENRPEYSVKAYDSSPEHIETSVNNSLEALSTKYIDCLLIHRPDMLTDPQGVEKIVQQLLEEGKIRSFGVSNFSSKQFKHLHDNVPLHTNQIEASLLQLDAFSNGTLEQLMDYHLRPMAWSPLGGGSVFSEEVDAKTQRIKNTATPLLEKYNCSMDQLLLAWLLRHPSQIIPVLGTTKLERVASAVQALDIEISRNDWYALYQASTGTTIA